MKSFFHIFLFLIISISYSSFAGDTKGNGTDFLEILFAEAKVRAAKIINKIDYDDINQLPITQMHKVWLKQDHPDFDNNLNALQVYMNQLSLSFLEYGEGGCKDPELQIEHGICYYDANPYIAKVVISKDRNKSLASHIQVEQEKYTPDNIEKNIKLAMIMLIHEAAHFTGETHHIKLDDLGAQLVAISQENYKLKKYSKSPFVEKLNGNMSIDENSHSVSFTNILVVETPLDSVMGSPCKLLNLGPQLSATYKRFDGLAGWHVLRGGLTKLYFQKTSNKKLVYENVTCLLSH